MRTVLTLLSALVCIYFFVFPTATSDLQDATTIPAYTEVTIPAETEVIAPSEPECTPTRPRTVHGTLFKPMLPNEWEENFIERIDWTQVEWYGDYRVNAIGVPTTTAGGYEFDREFLAKLLYCEARGACWEGQVFTCSVILNYCDDHGRSLWDVGHDVDAFSVAPWVDYETPNEMQYEVVDYVLSGGRIADIGYFRTRRYHSFGIPMCYVDGHYFSMKEK